MERLCTFERTWGLPGEQGRHAVFRLSVNRFYQAILRAAVEDLLIDDQAELKILTEAKTQLDTISHQDRRYAIHRSRVEHAEDRIGCKVSAWEWFFDRQPIKDTTPRITLTDCALALGRDPDRLRQTILAHPDIHPPVCAMPPRVRNEYLTIPGPKDRVRARFRDYVHRFRRQLRRAVQADLKILKLPARCA